MICVGLDWGRDSHTYAIAAPGGELLREGVVENKTWRFENWAKEVELYGADVRLVLESGNGLATPVEAFASTRGWEVARVTAAAVKTYREHIMGDNNKSDTIDARAIAFLGASSKTPATRSKDRLALRAATRDRDKLSKEKTRISNRLRQAIAEIMPEFTTEVFPTLDRSSILHLLIHHPDPLDWVRLDVAGIQMLLTAAKIRSRQSYIVKLVQLASQFRDVLQPGDKSVCLTRIRMLARRLKNCMDEHTEVVEFIEVLASEDADVQLLTSIAGAGLVTSAAIVAEVQDIKDFANESKLASFVGVALKKHQSGKSKRCAETVFPADRLPGYDEKTYFS